MNNKLTSGEQDKELSWEEAVARYLEDNPDYFLTHPGVLASLNIRQQENGNVVSLAERQTQAIREKNEALSRQLRELLAIARENDVLGGRLHQFAIAMIDSTALDEALSTARDMLRQMFKLDSVVILLKSDSAQLRGRPECVEPGDRRLDGILQKFAAQGQDGAVGKPLCGMKFDGDTMGYLYGNQAADIRSTALIMLTGSDTRGVLCLGSQDPLRFHHQMGTVYLSKLGELLMSGVARHL